MASFAKLKNAIPGVLKATGSDITLRFVTIGDYNETNGTVSESNTDVSVKALVGATLASCLTGLVAGLFV